MGMVKQKAGPIVRPERRAPHHQGEDHNLVPEGAEAGTGMFNTLADGCC